MRWLVLGLLGGAAWAQPLVVIDPGHGGRDPGAVGCGNREANAVVDIGRRIDGYLEQAGIRSELTQDDNTFVELRARATFANNRNARLFVSVHANANAGQPASGSETWIANGAGNTSRQLAGRLQAGMIEAWNLRDRGVKNANFTVLTATSMPAALIETGFINHCENDSRKLASAAQRDVMALAEANAIADQLGVDGPDGPGPAPADTGVLVGVVFEDVGVGLDDPSRRLAGATVRVQGTPLSARSAAETGAWRFELDPGDYRVTATLDGFQMGSRNCTVVANQDAWCSVGLLRGAPPPPDPDLGPPDPDQGPPDDAAPPPDAGEQAGDAGPTPDLGPGPRPDARPPLPDRGVSPGVDGGQFTGAGGVRPPPQGFTDDEESKDAGCACDQSGGPGWTVLVLILLAWPRRAGLLVVLLAALPQLAEAHVPDVPQDGEQAVGGDHAHTFSVRLGPPRVLLRGDWRAPRVAPDGASVLLDGRDGLYLLRAGKTERVTGPIADARWLDAHHFGYRSPAQNVGAVPLFGRHVDGTPIVPQPPAHGVFATVRDDQVHVVEHGVRYQISAPGDRYFAAQVAPDGGHVVYWGLKTGLHLYAVTEGRTTHIGSGGHPQFDPSGQYLVYERTTDEGAALTGADLFVMRVADGAVAPLTETEDHLELAPSLGGGQLVYREGDAIVTRSFAAE